MESSSVNDDKILLSYQAYMLAGTTAASNSCTNSTTTSSASREHNRAPDNDEKVPKKITTSSTSVTKRFRTVLTIFATTVSNEWLYYDDQLSTVLSSIDNIRQRLPMIYRQWVQRKKQRQIGQQGLPPWKQYNSNSKTTWTYSCFSLPAELTEEDLFQTLNHELQNHETYMAYVRKLLLQLSDAVQTASRQLDAAFLFYQQHSDTLATTYHYSYYYTASFLLDLACDGYTIISKELYQRQTLAQTKLFNTGMDQLLPEEDTYDVTTTTSSSGSLSDLAGNFSTCSSLVPKKKGTDSETKRLKLFLDHLLTPKK